MIRAQRRHCLKSFCQSVTLYKATIPLYESLYSRNLIFEASNSTSCYAITAIVFALVQSSIGSADYRGSIIT